MTAMVALDSGQSLDALLEVDLEDFPDFLKGSRSGAEEVVGVFVNLVMP
ncbi:MAG: hypothetical protein MZW92_67585, partial [Comamonadaceae bacterium]|nr:hypothetical protein [Comamonadaceae bacterium]